MFVLFWPVNCCCWSVRTLINTRSKYGEIWGHYQAASGRQEGCRAIAKQLATLNWFKETGSVQFKPKSVRPRSVCTKNAIEATRKKKQQTIHETNGLWGWNGMRVHAENRLQRSQDESISPAEMSTPECYDNAKRLQRAKLLQKWMKAWTDEKIFAVQAIHNHHNDRILAQNIKTVSMNKKTIFHCQHPASAMVWGGMTSCGKKTLLIFIPEGVKENQAVYLTMLNNNASVDKLAAVAGIILLPAGWSSKPHSQ